MSWHYQILHHDCGHPWYGLHEVYEFADSRSWTENPATFTCHPHEGTDGIIKSLEMALADAKQYPVLEVKE